MKLYIKQKVFSWKDKFKIFDFAGNEIFQVEGEFFSLGKKLHVCDAYGREVAFIKQKLLAFMPRFYICRNGEEIAEVSKKFTMIKQKYVVEEFGWTIEGDFWAHEYAVRSGDRVIASISKKWFTWGDTYEIDIADGVDYVNVLCAVLIIDAVLAQSSN